MMRLRSRAERPFRAVFMSAALCACTPGGGSAPVSVETRALRAETDALTMTMLSEAPEVASALAVPPAIAGGAYTSKLTDYSSDGQNRRISQATRAVRELEAINPKHLDPEDALTRAVAVSTLKDWIAGGDFGYGVYGHGAPQPYVVTHISGAYATTPSFLDSHHPIETGDDVEAYLSRLSAYAAALNAETKRITADAAEGVVPPAYIIDATIARLQPLADSAPEDTKELKALERRLEHIAGRTAYLSRATAIVENEVLPAYSKQVSALSILRSRATDDPGVARLPDGAKFYQTTLRAWTTTNLTPDEVHRMGLDMVARYDREMDALLRARGMTRGTVGERLRALSRQRSQVYPNTAQGRDQIIRDLNEALAVMQPRLPLYFPGKVKAQLEIKRAPPQAEAGAPGAYYQGPSLDGKRPGTFYVNLRNTAELPRFAVPTLAYHEGVPGHHWQIAFAQESKDIPLLRSALMRASGYVEGWGLYAEQLADEMGVYEDDPLGRLGYLQSMSFRAARLVVDTGIHAKGWSREQAIRYLMDVTGMERATVSTEVDRYIVWPGQACAYMVGFEELTRLRERAKTELGAAFDIRSFHAFILANGAAPLTILDQMVAAWIAEQKKPAQQRKPT